MFLPVKGSDVSEVVVLCGGISFLARFLCTLRE